MPAHVDFVDSTGYATTLHRNGVTAKTVEHLLATLHAYGVTNLLVKMQGEVPTMDGSALEFCRLIESVGLIGSGRHASRRSSSTSVSSSAPKARSSSPSSPQTTSASPIRSSTRIRSARSSTPISIAVPESFRDEIAPARTFGFLRDMKQLAAMGLASGGRLDNCILIDDEKVVNTTLRFPDEFVRHKILDIMGDVYLLGRPIRGMITARKTGHSDNIALLREIKKTIGLQ